MQLSDFFNIPLPCEYIRLCSIDVDYKFWATDLDEPEMTHSTKQREHHGASEIGMFTERVKAVSDRRKEYAVT